MARGRFAKKQRGAVDRVRSGALRVRVSAGIDPVTKRRLFLTEVVPQGTVVGRLGHASGGQTTLRVYTAWVSEADPRASTALADRVSERPKPLTSAERIRSIPRNPYEKLVVDVYDQVARGELSAGDELPSIKRLAADYGISIGTVQRAVQLLQDWGTVEVARSRRAQITANHAATVSATTVAAQLTEDLATVEPTPSASVQTMDNPALLEFEVRRRGEAVQKFAAEADPANAAHLRKLLAAAVRRDGWDVSEILDYELDVRRPDGVLLRTFVTMTG